MSQSTFSSPSSSPKSKTVVDFHKMSPPSDTTSKPSAASFDDGPVDSGCVKRPKSEKEKAPERPATPLPAPQGWEDGDEAELDFDFAAVPGADDWQFEETAERCAVWSAVEGAGAGVTVQFQKWDW
ncbi:hypothetical protein FRB90_001651 [Tulasnella sp. 427]|nr:hypothetical protein FRB90_001651 [Tulasnella sp. 427]